MSLWRQFKRGLRSLANRRTADKDISDEVASFMEQVADSLQAGGMSAEEAHRAARLQMGSVTGVQEQVRSYGWENAVETFVDSSRHALRRLFRDRGFTIVSVTMLALGIGATTAIFGVIDGVLLQPLPYPNPQQLVSLRHSAPGINIADLGMSPSLYFTYGDENHVFQDLSLWSTSTSSVTGLSEPEEVPVLMATHRLLPILGIQPAIGRAFTAADNDPKSTPSVMLLDGYWRTRFGGDRSVLGRRITIDGTPSEVIGILPASFRFMDQHVSLIMPLQFDRVRVPLVNFSYQGVARLRPGVSIANADRDLSRILPHVPSKFAPNAGMSVKDFEGARITPNLLPLKDDLTGDSGDTLWVLLVAVGILLLIACANVANLSLVRAEGRQQEFAVRTALGAGRRRLAGESLLECLLLGLAGCTLGLGIAYTTIRILKVSEVVDLPRLADISFDTRLVLFALGTSLLSGLLFGLISITKYMAPDLSRALKSGGRALSQSKERNRARASLVVVQVALAVVLLVSSGLMLRTLQALHGVDPGFSDPDHLQTIGISIPESQVKEPERVIQTQQEILQKLKSVAGVSSAAITNTVPMDGGSNDAVYAETQSYREGKLPAIRRYKFVSPGYVQALGSRLIAGRDLTWSETYQSRPVALVSANLAKEWWHDPQAAIGKRIRPTPKDDWREVVGVVADLHDKGVDQKAPAIVYWPLLQNHFQGRVLRGQRNIALLIRTPRAGSTTFLQEVRRSVWSVNPNLTVANMRTLGAIYDRSMARRSFTMILLLIAAGMAVLLGVVGIYGVISYAVSQRTREIGIRLALGAPLPKVTGIFVRSGVVLAVAGAVCGIGCALALTRLMKALLFSISPDDPLTYAAVVAGLMIAVITASYLPARRAAKVNPVEALRAE